MHCILCNFKNCLWPTLKITRLTLFFITGVGHWFPTCRNFHFFNSYRFKTLVICYVRCWASKMFVFRCAYTYVGTLCNSQNYFYKFRQFKYVPKKNPIELIQLPNRYFSCFSLQTKLQASTLRFCFRILNFIRAICLFAVVC